MAVEAKMQVIGKNGALTDSDQKPSKATQMFCQLMTDHYDLIAREYPQFAQLKNLAKASIIARAMLQKGCLINLELINRLFECEKTDKSSHILPTLTHTHYENNVTIKLVGGCDLTFDLSKKTPDILKKGLQQIIDDISSDQLK